MTLALYGKTRRRQAALVLAGFLAVIAASLYALSKHEDEAKAASQTFPVSATSCADAGAQPCSSTPALLAAGGGTVTLDMFPVSGADDDLTVTFDLSTIPAGSTLNTAILNVVTTGIVGGAGSVSCTLWTGSSASAEADGAYNTWGLPGSLQINSTAMTGLGYPNLANHVQAALGSTLTMRFAVACLNIPFNAAPAGTTIDTISLDVDWTPPPFEINKRDVGVSPYSAGEAFPWEIEVVVNSETSEVVQIVDTYDSAALDYVSATAAAPFSSCGESPVGTITCSLAQGTDPGTYSFSLNFTVPSNSTTCGDTANQIAIVDGGVTKASASDSAALAGNCGVLVINKDDSSDTSGASSGNPVAGATFRLERYDSVVDEALCVTDNAPSPSVACPGSPASSNRGDEDPAPGVTKVSGVQLGNWQAIEVGIPAGYQADICGSSSLRFLGTLTDLNPTGGNSGPGCNIQAPTTAFHNPSIPTHLTIQICKVWYLDAAGEIADPGTVNFSYNVSDTEENPSQVVTVPDVAEAGGPECVTIDVKPGLVEIVEIVPTDFVASGWDVFDGNVVAGNVSQSGGFAEIDVSQGGCEAVDQQSVVSNALGLVRDIQAVVGPPGSAAITCTVTFNNYDTANRLPSGSLRIEKYLDINRDGDADDPGEGLLDDWPITITSSNIGLGIAGNYLTGQATHPTGTLVFDGLDAGDSYDISEGTLPGYVVVSANLNGTTNLGAVTTVSDVEVPEGGTTVVRFFNSPSGSISVHKNTINVLNGIESENLNDDDGWRIAVDSTQCDVHVSGVTDANGNVTFSGLEMCSDYRVAEDLTQPGAVGYTPAGASAATGVKPGDGAPTLVAFTNETHATTPPCPNCSGAGPTTFQATPVATPVTPAATPTLPPTTPTAVPATPTSPAATATPDGAVAGEQPAGVVTPVAPSAGDYFSGRDEGVSLLVILAGAIAIVAGAGALAMGSRR